MSLKRHKVLGLVLHLEGYLLLLGYIGKLGERVEKFIQKDGMVLIIILAQEKGQVGENIINGILHMTLIEFHMGDIIYTKIDQTLAIEVGGVFSEDNYKKNKKMKAFWLLS